MFVFNQNPNETYLLKAAGESMVDADINPNYILFADRKN